MGTDNKDVYLKIETEPSGLISTDISKGLSLWETYDEKTEERAAHIVVDTASSAIIEYTDIPAIIKYLEHVYQIRVTEGRTALNKCEKCHQIIGRS